MEKIPVKPDVIGRWKSDDGVHYFDFFQSDLVEHGYELPKAAKQKKVKVKC